MSDPQSFCPFCKREHDAPEVLDYVKDLQSRLDAAEKKAADWKAMADYCDAETNKVREIARGFQSRLDSVRSLLEQWEEANKLGLGLDRESGILSLRRALAVENLVSETPKCRECRNEMTEYDLTVCNGCAGSAYVTE